MRTLLLLLVTVGLNSWAEPVTIVSPSGSRIEIEMNGAGSLLANVASRKEWPIEMALPAADAPSRAVYLKSGASAPCASQTSSKDSIDYCLAAQRFAPQFEGKTLGELTWNALVTSPRLGAVLAIEERSGIVSAKRNSAVLHVGVSGTLSTVIEPAFRGVCAAASMGQISAAYRRDMGPADVSTKITFEKSTRGGLLRLEPLDTTEAVAVSVDAVMNADVKQFTGLASCELPFGVPLSFAGIDQAQLVKTDVMRVPARSFAILEIQTVEAR